MMQEEIEAKIEKKEKLFFMNMKGVGHGGGRCPTMLETRPGKAKPDKGNTGQVGLMVILDPD